MINVDKEILKSVDFLPHSLTNSRDKFGPSSETFPDFVRWVTWIPSRAALRIVWPDWSWHWHGGRKVADFISRVGDVCPATRSTLNVPQTTARLKRSWRIRQDRRDPRRRGSTAGVVVDEQCNTFDDIRPFVSAKAAHLIQIKMRRGVSDSGC
ncbi:hypothetical protein [Mesorhizobium sp.]|uniref:hypothetical protein n=1 Tax=Mesorhizobium sp. TaxID=1871066 RepID=UPI00344B698F